MADTSAVWNTPAMLLEASLMDKRRWPCMRPGCHGKVDPDSPNQYCSKFCQNAVKDPNRVPNRDLYYRAMETARAASSWQRRFVHRLDDDIAKQAGTTFTKRPYQMQPPSIVRTTQHDPTKTRTRKFTFANDRWKG